jgi:hypothetical protein
LETNAAHFTDVCVDCIDAGPKQVVLQNGAESRSLVNGFALADLEIAIFLAFAVADWKRFIPRRAVFTEP